MVKIEVNNKIYDLLLELSSKMDVSIEYIIECLLEYRDDLLDECNMTYENDIK